MHVPFPLQCSDVIAKLCGYNNIAKGKVQRKGAEFSKVSQDFCLRFFNLKVLKVLFKYYYGNKVRYEDNQTLTSKY